MSPSVILVPGAPVLVPQLAGSAAVDTEHGVAMICDLLGRARGDATRVLVMGTDSAGRSLGDTRSTLARWGVDVPVGRPSSPPAPHGSVPGPALIAWWLLDRAGIDLPRIFSGVPGGARSAPGPLPASGDLVVVVADGPSCLSPRAPVPEDPRGVALDRQLAGWLRTAGELPDPGEPVAQQIGWGSRPAWRALAALVRSRPAAESLSWAPFGVGYHCAWWPAEGTADPDATPASDGRDRQSGPAIPGASS